MTRRDILAVLVNLEDRALVERTDTVLTAAGVDQAIARDSAGSSDRSAIMRGVLRVLVAREHGASAARAPIHTDAKGKPLFDVGPPFSLSYARRLGLIAVATADASIARLGCDIEVQRSLKMPSGREIAIRHLAGALPMIEAGVSVSQDLRIVSAEPPSPEGSDDVGPTLRAWVTLEARAKCDGDGVFALLSRHGIFGDRPAEHHHRAAHEIEPSLGQATVMLRSGMATADECDIFLSVAASPAHAGIGVSLTTFEEWLAKSAK